MGISLLLSFPQPVSFPPFLQVKPFDLVQQAQLDALATFMTYQNYVFYVAEIVAFSLALAAAVVLVERFDTEPLSDYSAK